MKTKIFLLVAVAATLLSFNAAAQAQPDPGAAMKNTFSAYKAQQDLVLNQYDARITELRARPFINTADQALFLKRMDSLNLQNTELRKRLANYKQTGNNQWDAFQKQFNTDTKRLDNSINGFSGNPPAVKPRRDSM